MALACFPCLLVDLSSAFIPVPHLRCTRHVKSAGPCYPHQLFKDGLFSTAVIGPDKDKAFSTAFISSELLLNFWELATPVEAS